MKFLARFRRSSLRIKILVPLVLLSFFVFLTTFLLFQEFLISKFENEINKRAQTFASTLVYYNDVTEDPNQIQRLVSTLVLESDVERIVITANDPPVIIASSCIQWRNKELASIPDLPESQFLHTASSSASDFHFKKHTANSYIYITSLKVMLSGNSKTYPGKGAVYIELDISLSMKELSNAIWLLAIGLFISMLLVTLLIYLNIKRFILKPASAITNTMIQRAIGETNFRIPLFFKDEIGDIARSLNEMLDQLDKESKQRTLAENQLRESETKLIETNSTKDRFFSIIAHDLKSPFNAILGFSKLLQEDYFQYTPEEHIKFISRINDGLTNVYRLLENLLDWSRIQLGRCECSPESLDIHLLALEVINFHKLALEKKGIGPSIDIPDNTIIMADQIMIKTILRNLVSNAIKFSQPGKTIIIRTINPEDSEKVRPGYIGISVVDQGTGIKKSNIDSLFRIDSNYRAKGTANEPGTGLGLILCKEFVQKNGGEIWIESEEGSGSEFIFTVPLSLLSK